MMKVEQQQAYVIHTKPFRDTSLLVECFTREYGRISLVAKGARKPKNHQRSLLQPFQLLSINWQGRGGLKTMTGAESIGTSHFLKSDHLYGGLYINELFLHLLAIEDVAEYLFDQYHCLLNDLSRQVALEPVLRQFEFIFLQELGYGIDFNVDAHTGESISSDKNYLYYPAQGFIKTDLVSGDHGIQFSGEILNKIVRNESSNTDVLKASKQLTRATIDFLLEGKPLKSREFFRQLIAQKNDRA